MAFDLYALDSLGSDEIDEILNSWAGFCVCTDAIIRGNGDLSAGSKLAPLVASLCKHGLRSLVEDHFLQALEETFKTNAVLMFWQHFEAFHSSSTSEMPNVHIKEDWPQTVLIKALEEICLEKCYQEKCLLILVHSFQSYEENLSLETGDLNLCESNLMCRYQLMVSAVLLATLPSYFPEILRMYFKKKLEELSTVIAGVSDDVCESQSEMDIDDNYSKKNISKDHKLVKDIGKVVRDLRSLGFMSMSEDAYASAIFVLLKSQVNDLAGDEYRNPVLESIKEWIQAVPLQFLHALQLYLGDSVDYDNGSSGLKSPLASPVSSFPGVNMPSELLVRWKLRLEYFAYETLQDLRIGKLFEIIVDYPDSSPAIEDLKQCLEYTGQHSKLVDSFISSLRYRLLTAGASTNDILHQYVSTIKALRTIDPTGVFLETVGEPIRDYLKGRKDTIKCIVTMLTDGNPSGSGNSGDSLLEELNRDVENQEGADNDDNINSDDKQAWINAECWEPDPAEVDPTKGSNNRRKIDILAMIVSLIGSKDQLVNEYRVMLAEKLLNKLDYDFDSEIRTLELLKIHFGESSMQKCEIMLNDLIDSKRTNANIKASIPQTSQTEQGENDVSLNLLDATIISTNFWPPIQAESLNIPTSIDQLLSDYAKRFHDIKTPRKLLWKKNLGAVKLELQFEDQNMQFTVAPIHAVIITKFQDQTSWTSKNLAAAIGIPVETLNRRISFWVGKGILAESVGTASNDHVFTIADGMIDANRNGITNGNSEELSMADEEGDNSVASVEEQLQKEMTIYEKFIIGMLTNFGSMALDRIHNTLKMFCVAEPAYDKSLQQLQSFLSGLVSEEKLEMKDGLYFLKK
ncbi:anaphase-promoting complex subunit 2 isoform X1 [Dioscorea cayenensis subsp. rotundata]|uniref:Anaphase-promoting complex subunit 2 n=1 Tax=Dioscorea cayennensis subsp. rotundata TaxID=55577 RepID=A0AB40C182_DIOCR|nr:anaphase-promoting complex subunit 2 isoform X1 [Dioscorea cayenensis subsp. rotundata]XP_039133520.1 anaphase-promoting complex subunit 2 isoform X1 [Dioscorea cayenensis subsp. rotundata]